MPRCAPCTAFADFAEVPPVPQPERKWSSRAEMIASARKGCDLCTLCWQYADVWASAEEHLNQPMQLRRHYNLEKTNSLVPFALNAGGWLRPMVANDLRYTPPLLEAEEDPISQAHHILSQCLSSHGECGKIEDAGLDGRSTGRQDDAACYSTQRSLPRRLLDLSQSSEVLVVDVEACIHDGNLSVAELSQYCTLSYRWGDTPHGCVLRAPFARQISIDVECMPQTFRDAIETTRRLGFRFLWIDALCIVQPDACGDDVDWNAEGPRMGTIYHNAICTIAATSAHSATDGFLLKTGSERIPAVPCKVLQHMENGEPHARWLETCFTHFDHAVTHSALNKRGWVTQEQLLSRRVLHFTVKGVILECRSGLRHGHSSVSKVWSYDPLPRDVDKLVFRNKHQLWGGWMTFVRHYSKTEFSNPEDRLVALSSLARAVHRKLDHDDLYCAGLWRNSLLDDLLWVRCHLSTPETPKRLSIAPTWSWASIQGEIFFLNLAFRQRSLVGADYSAQILDVKLAPTQRNNAYGNIEDGRIKLVAQVVTVSIGTEYIARDGKAPLRLRIENQGCQWYPKVVRSIDWDAWQGDRIEEKEYTIVPIQFARWEDQPIKGNMFEWTALIVEQVYTAEFEPTVEDRIPTYRRIGVLQDGLFTEDFDRLLAEAPTYNYGRSELRRETMILV